MDASTAQTLWTLPEITQEPRLFLHDLIEQVRLCGVEPHTQPVRTMSERIDLWRRIGSRDPDAPIGWECAKQEPSRYDAFSFNLWDSDRTPRTTAPDSVRTRVDALFAYLRDTLCDEPVYAEAIVYGAPDMDATGMLCMFSKKQFCGTDATNCTDNDDGPRDHCTPAHDMNRNHMLDWAHARYWEYDGHGTQQRKDMTPHERATVGEAFWLLERVLAGMQFDGCNAGAAPHTCSDVEGGTENVQEIAARVEACRGCPLCVRQTVRLRDLVIDSMRTALCGVDALSLVVAGRGRGQTIAHLGRLYRRVLSKLVSGACRAYGALADGVDALGVRVCGKDEIPTPRSMASWLGPSAHDPTLASLLPAPGRDDSAPAPLEWSTEAIIARVWALAAHRWLAANDPGQTEEQQQQHQYQPQQKKRKGGPPKASKRAIRKSYSRHISHRRETIAARIKQRRSASVVMGKSTTVQIYRRLGLHRRLC